MYSNQYVGIGAITNVRNVMYFKGFIFAIMFSASKMLRSLVVTMT